jgi:hypothetical protein
LWQLVDNPPPSILEIEGDINCQTGEDLKEQDESINLCTQVIVEIAKDKEIELRERFNILFPTIKGQCLNTKDFQLIKESLIAEISKSLNPTDVINNFLNNYSDIINGSQKKQLVAMIDSE